MTEHITHDSSKYPVEGCKKCDKEIGRPILRGFGLGKSSVVIQPKKDENAGA